MSIAQKLNREFASTPEFAAIIEEAIKEQIELQLEETLKEIEQLKDRLRLVEVKVASTP